MSIDDPTAGFEERLRQLIDLRKIEEQKYGDLLTRLDQIWKVDDPQELKPKISEIKDSLNHSWDLSTEYLSALDAEDRLFWKEVARNLTGYIEPFIKQQKYVNSLVVHLVNEYSEALQHSLNQIQTFHETLIHYFQRIVPVIDTKFREMTGTAENFQLGLREYSDLIFQQLDKKILTLQVDLDNLKSLRTSVQSLHHLANSLDDRGGSMTRPVMERTDSFFHAGESPEITEALSPILEQLNGVSDCIAFCPEGSKLSDICKKLGMELVSQNTRAEIRLRQENSLGGILCAEQLEHLSPEEVLDFLRTAHTRLKPGGRLILTAINVGSASGFFGNFLTDPARLTPLHPETLKFLASATGFQNPEITFVNPVRAPHKLRLFPNPATEQEKILNENFEKLNHLLYEPGHYALLAQK